MTVVASLTSEEDAGGDWRAVQATRVSDVLERIKDFVPALSEHVEVMTVAHPPGGAERTSNFCGAPYGWAVTPQQSGMRRLAHETPIENLYLTGHWTIPGPGVCAVVASGWRVANRIAAREPAVSRPADGRTGTSALA
jgi:phytoene dehydrogenase-like protein